MPTVPDPFKRLCSGLAPTRLTVLRAGTGPLLNENSFAVLAMVAIFSVLTIKVEKWCAWENGVFGQKITKKARRSVFGDCFKPILSNRKLTSDLINTTLNS